MLRNGLDEGCRVLGFEVTMIQPLEDGSPGVVHAMVTPRKRLKGTVREARLESNCRLAPQQLSGGGYNRTFWLDGSGLVGKNGNASRPSGTASVPAIRHPLLNRLTWAVLAGFPLAVSLAVAQEP